MRASTIPGVHVVTDTEDRARVCAYADPEDVVWDLPGRIDPGDGSLVVLQSGREARRPAVLRLQQDWLAPSGDESTPWTAAMPTPDDVLGVVAGDDGDCPATAFERGEVSLAWSDGFYTACERTVAAPGGEARSSFATGRFIGVVDGAVLVHTDGSSPGAPVVRGGGPRRASRGQSSTRRHRLVVMTPSSLRLRLAVALGLPAIPACKPAPEPEPTTVPTTTAPTNSATPTPTRPAAARAARRACKPDQVHERVCGLVDLAYEGAGGTVAAPHEMCTRNALSLWNLETEHMIDGWRVGSHDAVLASFTFDREATTTYAYSGSYQPDAPRCCYERCNPIESRAQPRARVPDGMKAYELCVPGPVSTKFPAPGAKQCPAALRTRHFYPYGAPDPLDDAPFERALDDQCCYMVATAHRCPPNTFETKNGGCEEPSPGGRPLREAGEVVTAATRARDGWSRSIALGRAPSWSPSTRAQAAVGWAREAAFEHASVAAFARLAIDLMVHGAPADLVDDAHAAARDEVRHAQECYGIASAFADAPMGPGPLPLATLTPAASITALAVECFRDGCVNETVAALCVAEASRRAASPAVRDTLARIADDEGRHAELSYRILAWALRSGGAELHARIVTELDAVRAELARVVDTATDLRDETTGLLASHTAAAVRRRVLAEVVVPCTEALLAAQVRGRGHYGQSFGAPGVPRCPGP